MTHDVRELLREGIDRLAADADAAAPATLLHRARQHNRRRRQAIAGAIATGTAGVTAAAVIAATAGTPQPSALHSQTITYVATRAEQALAQLNPSRAIEVNTLTTRGSNLGFSMQDTAATDTSPVVPNALSNVHASSEVDWSYNGIFLQHGYSAAGKLVYTITTGSQGYSGAAYPARIRWHNPLTGSSSSPPGGDPSLTCDNAGFGYPSWKQGVSKALSCHLFSLAGNQQVDGIDTIKLVRTPSTFDGQTTRETLWVDPKTYLPLRITAVSSAPHQRTATLTTNFRWLPATQANLTSLRAAEQRGVIPASFRALPSTYLPLAGFDGPGAPG